MEISKGECTKTSRHGGSFYIETEKETICKMERGFHSEANAQLITEAFNVANETGFSPRQLAEQKAVLVKAIQYYFSVLEEVNGKSWNNNPDHVLSEMLKAIKQAN